MLRTILFAALISTLTLLCPDWDRIRPPHTACPPGSMTLREQSDFLEQTQPTGALGAVLGLWRCVAR